jgi:hypothetical protein
VTVDTAETRPGSPCNAGAPPPPIALRACALGLRGFPGPGTAPGADGQGCSEISDRLKYVSAALREARGAGVPRCETERPWGPEHPAPSARQNGAKIAANWVPLQGDSVFSSAASRAYRSSDSSTHRRNTVKCPSLPGLTQSVAPRLYLALRLSTPG